MMGWTSKTRERLQGGLWVWGSSSKVGLGLWVERLSGREKRKQVRSVSELASFWCPRGSHQDEALVGTRGSRGASPPGTGASTVTEPVPAAKPGPWPERGSPRKVGSVLGEETGRSGEEAAAHPKG